MNGPLLINLPLIMFTKDGAKGGPEVVTKGKYKRKNIKRLRKERFIILKGILNLNFYRINKKKQINIEIKPYVMNNLHEGLLSSVAGFKC